MSINIVSDVQASRFDVDSSDGTSIAVWVEGEGPALVLVHGSIADHTTFDPFVAVLGHDPTTFSMDRRGFALPAGLHRNHRGRAGQRRPRRRHRRPCSSTSWR